MYDIVWFECHSCMFQVLLQVGNKSQGFTQEFSWEEEMYMRAKGACVSGHPLEFCRF